MSEIILSETDNRKDSIRLPIKHKAQIIIWNDLSLEQVEQINGFETIPEIQRFLADVFELQNYKSNLKHQIELDLYVNAVKFAQDHGFSAQQLSTFVSMIKQIHKISIETPFGNLDEVFQYLKDLLVCHGVNRPPYSSELFTVDEIHLISHYVVNTYIRHFKMYKYAFTPLVKLNLVIKYIGESEIMETPEPESVSETALEKSSELSQPEEVEKTEEKENPARECLKNLIGDVLHDEIQNLLKTIPAQPNGTEGTPKETAKRGAKK